MLVPSHENSRIIIRNSNDSPNNRQHHCTNCKLYTSPTSSTQYDGLDNSLLHSFRLGEWAARQQHSQVIAVCKGPMCISCLQGLSSITVLYAKNSRKREFRDNKSIPFTFHSCNISKYRSRSRTLQHISVHTLSHGIPIEKNVNSEFSFPEQTFNFDRVAIFATFSPSF